MSQKNIINTVLIYIFLIVFIGCGFIVISTMFLFTDETIISETSYINFTIPNFSSEKDRIDEIKKVCNDYCSEKYITEIHYSFEDYNEIISKKGNVEYIFWGIVSKSNISIAKIDYSISTNCITTVEVQEGPSKAFLNSDRELRTYEWSKSINDVIDLFMENYSIDTLKLITQPKLEIKIYNDIAHCYLFDKSNSDCLEKIAIDLISGKTIDSP